MKRKSKDMESNVIQPAENMDIKLNKKPPKYTANKESSGQMKTQKTNARTRKILHNEIETDEQKTGQAILFLGHYDINQIEMFTSCTKTLLLARHNHINQSGIFTSAPCLPVSAQIKPWTSIKNYCHTTTHKSHPTIL